MKNEQHLPVRRALFHKVTPSRDHFGLSGGRAGTKDYLDVILVADEVAAVSDLLVILVANNVRTKRTSSVFVRPENREGTAVRLT